MAVPRAAPVTDRPLVSPECGSPGGSQRARVPGDGQRIPFAGAGTDTADSTFSERPSRRGRAIRGSNLSGRPISSLQ